MRGAREILRIAEHATLIAGVLVEDIDVLADHLVGSYRKKLLKRLQRFGGGRIQILNLQVAIREHDVDRRVINHARIALVDGAFLDRCSDVRGELHDFEHLPVKVEDRVVAGLNPNFPAALADALVFRRLELAFTKVAPELPVLGAGLVGGFDKEAVMLAFDLSQRVAERREKVLVGSDDGAVEVELDHCLNLADGLELTGGIGVPELAGADVRGELHDFHRLSALIEDRVVAGLNPDFRPSFGDAFVFRRLELALAEIAPELFILGARLVGRLDKQTVVLTLNLIQGVAKRLQEIIVRGDDGAVEFKLDDRLNAVDGGDLTAQILHVDFRRRVDGTFGGGASIGFAGSWIGGGCGGGFHGCLVCVGTTLVVGWCVDDVRR